MLSLHQYLILKTSGNRHSGPDTNSKILIMNLRKYIFLSVTFVALLLSFYSNFFHLTPQKFFTEFDTYNEGFIYGRIMNSEEKGFFSDGCFSGIKYDTLKIHKEGKMDKDTIAFIVIQRLPKQKAMYLNNIERESDFGPYFTQMGTMASVYSIINIMLSGSPESKLNSLMHYSMRLYLLCFSGGY